MRKFISFIATSAILLNSLYAPISALAQEVSPTPESTPEATQMPEATQIPESTPEITPESTVSPTEEPAPTETPASEKNIEQESSSPSPTPFEEIKTSGESAKINSEILNSAPTPKIEKVCLTDEEIKDTVNENWNINNTEGTAETKDKVALGVKYVFPLENKVTVTFKCLPKDENLRTSLKIQKVKVSDLKLPNNVKPTGEWAYDITTGMEDGNFEYEVTLPKQEDQTAEVSYIEKSVEDATKNEIKSDEVKAVEEEKIAQEGDKVKAEGLNHFTIYIATYADSGLTTSETTYLQGDTVYVKASSLSSSKYYKIDVIEQNGSTTHNIVACTTGVTSLSGSYVLSSSAPIGSNWQAKITKYDNSTNCGSGSSVEESGSVNFTVKATNPLPLANPTMSQTCGLDIALVVDNSNSIDSSELSQMKTALNGFVTALSGTPTQFSVTKFGTNASVVRSFTSDTNSVTSAINGISTGGGGTNWKEGIATASGTFSSGTSRPNLMIFASDGNPTFPNCGGSSTCDADVNAAVTEANTAKQDSIRILALGIGDGLLVENLKAISGHIVNGSNISTTDVITTDFAGMAAKLSAFATKTCGGTITINKYIDSIAPANLATDVWTFNTNISGYPTVQTTAGQVNIPVLAGSGYSITETSVLSGYTFGSASCKKSTGGSVGTPSGQGVTGITVGNDDIIHCDFINTLNKGTIIIVKDAVPNDPQDFSFTGNLGNFDLNDDNDPTLSNTKTFSNVTPGTYTVTEPNVSGWDLTNVVCNDTNSTGNVNNRNAVIQLDAGETVTCTFTNTKQKGHLVVQKTTIPSGDSTSFAIEATGSGTITGGGAGTVTDSTDKDYEVTPGTYSVTETVSTGWEQTGNTCSNVVVGAAETKYCEIKNTKYGSITIVKDAQPDSTQSFGFTTTGTGLSDFALSDDGSIYHNERKTFTNLSPGEYTVTENSNSDWALTSLSCNDSDSTGDITNRKASIKLSAGENVTCTFTNIMYGSISVQKNVDLNGDGDFTDTEETNATDWTWKLNGDSGHQTNTSIGHLLPATYTISEVQKDGYHVNSLICGWNNYGAVESHDVALVAGQQLYCTFTNTRDTGTIELKKVWSGTGGQTNLNIGTTAGGTEIVTVQTGASGGTPLTTGQKTVPIGTYYLSESGGLDNYTKSPLSCFNDTNNNGSQDTGESTVTAGTDDSVSVAKGYHIVCSYTNARQTGTIIVKKVMVGGTDTFTFTGTPTGTINTNNGTLSATVDTGSYTVTEDSKDGWQLVNISCNDRTSTTPSTTDLTNRKAVFNVDRDETVTCTFTNTILPKITITKTVTNHGLTYDSDHFAPYKVGDTTVFLNQATTFNPGTYTVSETADSNYTATFGEDCDSNGSVTLVAGDNKTCTITNEEKLTRLTLVKTVTNDDGGQALATAWTLTATGPTTTISGKTGDTSITNAAVNSGTYTLSESGGSSGYTTGSWSCTDGSLSGNQITLSSGQSVTCTITNDDIAPTLTLIKEVINDNGGSALASSWTLSATGDGGFSGNGTQDSTLNKAVLGPTTVKANVGYLLGESGPSGYTAGTWSCTGGAMGTSSPTITLKEGESATCTITNDDQLTHLIVIKHVDNTHGGAAKASDFTMTINGVTVVGANSFYGAESPGTTKTVLPGTYYVTESGPSGYDSNASADCSGTIALGETKTCTITNSDKPATLTVIKHVIKDNGGTASAGDFTISVSGKNVSSTSFAGSESGVSVTLDAGSFKVDEITNNGYSKTLSGACSGKITAGESKTCTIINNDKPATLKIKKVVDGGNLRASDFSFSVNGESAIKFENDGQNNLTVDAGTYTVTEPAVPGYTTTYNNCSGIVLVNGASATCTITNTRDTGTLTIVKHAINHSSQNFGFETNFDTSILPGTQHHLDLDDRGFGSNSRTFTLPTDSYQVTEDETSGWRLTNLVCIGDNNPSVSISDRKAVIDLDKGENVTCKFTNTELAEVEGYKFNDRNMDGNKDPFEPFMNGWKIFIDQDGDGVYDSGEPYDTTSGWLIVPLGYYHIGHLLPGNYTVCEEMQTGWTNVTPQCQSISLTPGQYKHVNFGNMNYGSVTVTKFNDVDQNGEYDDGENVMGGWNITLGTTTKNTEDNGQVIFNNLLAGGYDLSETIPAGSNWVQTGIYCDGDGTFNGSQVVVVPGKNINCYIGNFELKPVISLTKANNIVGSTSAGATVTYTVIVSNGGNTELNGVDITDFLPGGFAYVAGTSKVGDVLVSDPTISSSGSVLYWENIGNISPTKTITLTYQAKINSDAANGIYTNYAVSKADYGITQTQPLVGFVKVAYAQEIETAKEIESNLDSSAVTIGNSLSYGGTLGGGQVLGASTELPATGSPTWILLGAMGMITCGAFLNIYSRKERRKYEKN